MKKTITIFVVLILLLTGVKTTTATEIPRIKVATTSLQVGNVPINRRVKYTPRKPPMETDTIASTPTSTSKGTTTHPLKKKLLIIVIIIAIIAGIIFLTREDQE